MLTEKMGIPMKSKVLIVDDIPENIDVLGGILCHEYQISAAIDGDQAIRVAVSNPPDLILLDVMMPKINGYEVCRRLKSDERTSDVPVIFVTAKNDGADELEGFAVGAVDYIRKPVNEMVVKSRVRSHLALKNYQKALERHAMQQQMMFESLFSNAPFGIMLTDRNDRVMSVNKKFETLFGYSVSDFLEKGPSERLVPEALQDEQAERIRQNLKGKTVVMETERVARSGQRLSLSVTSYPVDAGMATDGIFYLFEDITQRKQLEKELRHQALHDPLTQIPNRALMMERIRRANERLRRRPEGAFAVLLIDLDRFKELNDSLGHEAGDKMLVAVTRKIQGCLRSVDTLARLGGDEFVVLLEDVGSFPRVEEIARRIQVAIQTPVAFNDVEVKLSASIGIVVQGRADRSPEELLRDADMAMYCAKDSGKSCFRYYEADMHKRALERIKVEHELRFALERNEFKLHFQPIVTVDSGSISGFEALIRWCHPKYGLIPPLKFIPVAEASGMINTIGSWVLDAACAQLKKWQQLGEPYENLAMNVNISVNQFLQPNFIPLMDEIIERHAVDPAALRLEITETLLMEHSDTAVEKLREIKRRGIRIAVDDFGTGYSSLAYIHDFPMDLLKIDRSFIRKMTQEGDASESCFKEGGAETLPGDPKGYLQKSYEVVKTIVMMAKSLGIEVIAEGVENEKQLALLKTLGCDKVQGYLFSKPLPEQDVPMILEKYHV